MSDVSHVLVSKNATNLEMLTPGNWTGAKYFPLEYFTEKEFEIIITNVH